MTDQPHDETQTEKDTSYSPSSGRETEQLQDDADSPTAADSDVDDSAITTLPGTGGPDDAGDVDVDDEGIRSRIAERDVDPGDRPVG